MIDVHLGAGELTTALQAEAAHGLAGEPKQLSPKWFYDDRGSQLFDAITRLPEYYPTRGRRLVAFLGGTIGNLGPSERAEFLRTIAVGLAPGDCLLLGTDLVKPIGRLVAAYDDAQGVTAAFNRNVLLVLNRALDATF